MTDLNRLSATAAVAAIRARDISSEQLVAACLARIAERDKSIGAWAHLDTDLALSKARAADAKQATGAALGALHGVPVGIKDIIDTRDLPTENGTPIFAGRRPLDDAAVVKRLEAAGAVVLGKTVTTELAFFGPGKTRNPANPDHTPGGSSSGSAAAVADFQVPLALGTQTAGSIIRPASYCGVIGFKPTFGAVARTGVLEQSPPLDTIGGYARTLDDVRLLMAAISDMDLFSAKPAAANADTKQKFAFVKTQAWPQGDGSMRAAFETLVQKLGEDRVDEVALPPIFDNTGGLQRAVQFHDIAKNYGPLLDANPNVISEKLKDVIAIGRTVSDYEYAAANAQCDVLYEALKPMLSQYCAILTPAAAGPAPKGLSSTGSPMFNFLWTYLGMPTVSVPILEAGGLPLGVQLAGARGADSALLETGKSITL